MSPLAVFCSVGVALSIALRAAASVAFCALAHVAVEPSFSIGVTAGSGRGRGDCVASFPFDRANTQFKLSGAWNFSGAWDAGLAQFRARRFLGGDSIQSGVCSEALGADQMIRLGCDSVHLAEQSSVASREALCPLVSRHEKWSLI